MKTNQKIKMAKIAMNLLTLLAFCAISASIFTAYQINKLLALEIIMVFITPILIGLLNIYIIHLEGWYDDDKH